MARRRIRRGVGEGVGRGDPGRRRGWWNRKPPPRGSLVPRSTISRQHNSSPLVHSPQPSGTAETSTLILLAGSLPPFSPLPRSLARSLAPCPHSSLALAGERPTASLVLFLPQLHPSVPTSHARARLHPATPPSRPLCFNNTVYIGTRSIDLFARRPPRVRRARRWTYRMYGQGGGSVVPMFSIRADTIEQAIIRMNVFNGSYR